MIIDGIWRKNQATVALLGLCPLLAVSNSVISALGLGLSTLLVLICSNTLISLSRHYIPEEIRIPIFVGIIASTVTIIELLLNAWWHELYLTLGIFIPLIVTNCMILARAESFASKNTPLHSAWDGFCMGLGFLLVLILLGAIREILGQGTLLHNAHLLFGDQAKNWTLHLIDFHLIISLLPAGAFISLGFIIALKQYLSERDKPLSLNGLTQEKSKLSS